MSKFSALTLGPRFRKAISLPLPGARVDPETGKWVGPTDELHVRALRDDEYADVLERALAFAREKGLEEPEDGDPIYERGKMVHTLAIACLDKDSPDSKPETYFDTWKQVHTSEIMTPEVVGYLYFQQQMVQEEASPLIKGLSPEEFLAAVLKTAQGDISFFVNSRPGVLWTFTRTLASQLLASQTRSSSTSLFSSETPKEQEQAAPRPRAHSKVKKGRGK